MKTPDEIKLAMDICYETGRECRFCPYENVTWCEDQLAHDACAYFKQIEAERGQLLDDLHRMINKHGSCDFCKHKNKSAAECNGCSRENDNWTWRGVPDKEE